MAIRTTFFNLAQIDRAAEATTKLVSEWIDELNDVNSGNMRLIDNGFGQMKLKIDDIDGEIAGILVNIDGVNNAINGLISGLDDVANHLAEDLKNQLSVLKSFQFIDGMLANYINYGYFNDLNFNTIVIPPTVFSMRGDLLLLSPQSFAPVQEIPNAATLFFFPDFATYNGEELILAQEV